MAYQALELFRDWNESTKEIADPSEKDDDWLSVTTDNEEHSVSWTSLRTRWTALPVTDYLRPTLVASLLYPYHS